MNSIKYVPYLPALLSAGLLLGAAGCNRTAPIETAQSETHNEEEAGHEEAGHEKEGGEEAGHEEAGHEEGGHDEHGTEEIKFDGATAQESGVQVQTISATPLISGLPVIGSIEPSPNGVVRVASVVPGRIVRLSANVGQRVTKGQVLAVLESRSIGEAQSAFGQATARLQNASSNLRIVQAQAKAGVFSRAPLETARGRLINAQADVRVQENALRGARVALENAQRLVRAGSFASPAVEAARRERAQAEESLKTARAALTSATSSVTSAQSELARRREIAAGGGYSSRPVQEAQRLLTASQSAQNASQSEVATARANLSRAKSLAAE
ncbi:biotin/lipoyl-binding protein, partial [bacterium]